MKKKNRKEERFVIPMIFSTLREVEKPKRKAAAYRVAAKIIFCRLTQN
jgi:hypothetical protein